MRNVLAGKSTKEFWCPGSTLKVNVDNTNPIAYGMPAHGLALYLDSPAFEITAQDSQNYEVVARYVDRELLESGWLVGEENLAHKAAVVDRQNGPGPSGAARLPGTASRADARHLQAAVQRAGAVMPAARAQRAERSRESVQPSPGRLTPVAARR